MSANQSSDLLRSTENALTNKQPSNMPNIRDIEKTENYFNWWLEQRKRLENDQQTGLSRLWLGGIVLERKNLENFAFLSD